MVRIGKSIGTIPSSASGAAVQDYTFTDASPVSGINYYRLKEVDNGGDVKYSSVKTVQFGNAAKMAVSTWPNPFVSSIQLQSTADKNQPGTIRLINMGGQVIYNKNVQLVQGQNTFTVDGLDNNANGLYFLELQTRQYRYTGKNNEAVSYCDSFDYVEGAVL